MLDLSRLDSADPREREVARRRLLTTSEDDAAWRSAWIRWFAGSAAIAKAGDDADAALAGVLDLTHVLALEDAAPVSLRRASLELAASTLARIGRTEDADVLDSILTFERPGGRGSETAP